MAGRLVSGRYACRRPVLALRTSDFCRVKLATPLRFRQTGGLKESDLSRGVFSRIRKLFRPENSAETPDDPSVPTPEVTESENPTAVEKSDPSAEASDDAATGSDLGTVSDPNSEDPKDLADPDLEQDPKAILEDSMTAAEAVSEVAEEVPEEVPEGVSEDVSEEVEEEVEEKEEEEDKDPFGLQELFKEVSDSKGFGQRGEIWVLGQGLAVFAVLFPPVKLVGVFTAVGLAALAVGIGLMAYGVFSCGRSISPLPTPREKAKLVVDGIYAQIRHPMYGGLILACGGLSAISGSEVRGIFALILWWLLERKVKVEEAALIEKYPDYTDYMESVPRKFFPYIY